MTLHSAQCLTGCCTRDEQSHLRIGPQWTVIHEQTETAGMIYAAALRVWNF
jgi:hypothetical protein